MKVPATLVTLLLLIIDPKLVLAVPTADCRMSLQRGEKKVSCYCKGGRAPNLAKMLRGVAPSELHFTHCTIGVEVALAKQSQLKTLKLVRSKLENPSDLLSLANLVVLKLEDVETRPIPNLGGLRQLVSVGVKGENVDSLSFIANHQHLRVLSIWGTQIGRLEDVGELADLRYLFLHRVPFDHIWGVDRFPKLELLDVWESDVRDLSPLCGVVHLASAKVESTSAFTLPQPGCALASSLSTLDIRRTNITNLEQVADFRALRDLHVGLVTSLKPIGNLPKLEHLSITSGTTRIDLSPLSSARSLTRLGFDSCWPRSLAPLTKVRSLKLLEVMGRSNQLVCRELAVFEKSRTDVQIRVSNCPNLAQD